MAASWLTISDIAGRHRILDNNADYVDVQDMLAELQGDNKQLVAEMRRVYELCDAYSDVATASLLEVWIDETEPCQNLCIVADSQASPNAALPFDPGWPLAGSVWLLTAGCPRPQRCSADCLEL